MSEVSGRQLPILRCSLRVQFHLNLLFGGKVLLKIAKIIFENHVFRKGCRSLNMYGLSSC